MLVKVYLIPSIIPLVVGCGLLEDGNIVAIPTKLIINFLPETDEKGPFIILHKNYLTTIKPNKFNKLKRGGTNVC
jgi:hypothetical protein